MGEKFVVARARGLSHGSGIGTCGIVTRSEAISELRSYWAAQKTTAEKILALPDSEIETWIVDGVHAQRRVRELT